MTGLGISRILHAALSADAGIEDAVGDRNFPISTVTSTTFPFIVYERTAVEAVTTKDGLLYDKVTCTVYVLADTYSESVGIAENVREVLDGYHDGNVDNAEFSGASEAFTNDTFVQQLQFTFEMA